MNQNTLDSLVEGYQSIIHKLSLPDAGDRHVLAAAIYSNASIIVTFNLKDFPSYTLDQYGIEAIHPDDFMLMVLNISLEALLLLTLKVSGLLVLMILFTISMFKMTHGVVYLTIILK